MRGQTPRWHWLALAGGALFSATCIVCAICWNSIFDSFIASQMRLTPGSETFKNWKEPTLPMYQDVYMFNWTNADKFPEEKPIMHELGPYRYREYRKQVNISVTSQNDTIGYRTLKRWQYEPELGTNRSLDDNVTMVNVIAASAVYRSRYWDYFRQKGVSMGLAMFGQKISVSKLVKELLFEGYEDPLLDLAKSLPASVTGGAPRVDRFGLFYGRNDSIEEDGYHEVTTGRYGLPGQILKWNGNDHLPFFEGQCSKLEGTVGGFYPRNLTEDSTYIRMFMSQLCRTVTLKYDGSGLMKGIPYNTYAFYEGTFDNSSSRPENACFCNGPCSWSGIMNISACSYGSPSFLSLPHFLHGSPDLQLAVGGLQPDVHRHHFYFKIDAKLGVPLEVAGRFQFNVLMEPSANIALYSQVPRILIPVFWVEQRFQISDEMLSNMRSAHRVAEWGGGVCAVAAAVSAALVAAAALWIRRQEKMATKKVALEKQMDEAEIKLNPDKCDYQ